MADKWYLAFIPPDHHQLIKDWIMDKGEGEHIYSPKIAYIRAVEEFLIKRGYHTQVEELREAFKQKRPMRVFSTEKLSNIQKEAVRLIMKYKQWGEQETIRWVLDHPEEVAKAVKEV